MPATAAQELAGRRVPEADHAVAAGGSKGLAVTGVGQAADCPLMPPQVVAHGPGGETYNINADHVAGRLAAEMRAEKLILLTDVRGILRDVGDPESLIPELSVSEARELLRSGGISNGMIPKIEACLAALDAGVPRAHVIDGRAPHGLLTELFSDRGIGTMIAG